MDITARSFERLLPRVLSDIADSEYAALDMEFSGIARQDAISSGEKKRTLQDRYHEVKDAAKTFAVLQIGLTFVKRDPEAGSFTLRPYNLHLNPLLDQKLEIERRWTYQSSAIDFLLRHGFQMEAPYKDGLRYLSRREEALALAMLEEKEKRRKALEDIKEESMTPEDIAFVREVRRMMNAWIDNKKGDKYLNIPPPVVPSSNEHIMPAILNGYQKRLVHQTIRTHYPYHVSMGKDTFVQVIDYDERREKLVKEDRARRLRERIAAQVGFRWIFEALVGGDISTLVAQNLRFVSEDDDEELDEEESRKLWRGLQMKLRSHRPVLIGHNVFCDLVYLYTCFVGNLPERVERFQELAHKLFPVVIDTKYLATHAHATAQDSSLREILDSLRHISNSSIVIDRDHFKYNLDSPQHEAGYDSLMTAQVFLKLATKLYKEKQHRTESSLPQIEQPMESTQEDQTGQLAVLRTIQPDKPSGEDEGTSTDPATQTLQNGSSKLSAVSEDMESSTNAEATPIPKPPSLASTVMLPTKQLDRIASTREQATVWQDPDGSQTNKDLFNQPAAPGAAMSLSPAPEVQSTDNIVTSIYNTNDQDMDLIDLNMSEQEESPAKPKTETLRTNKQSAAPDPKRMVPDYREQDQHLGMISYDDTGSRCFADGDGSVTTQSTQKPRIPKWTQDDSYSTFSARSKLSTRTSQSIYPMSLPAQGSHESNHGDEYPPPVEESTAETSLAPSDMGDAWSTYQAGSSMDERSKHGEEEAAPSDDGVWVPDQSDVFWKKYVNKLRVYGTVEEVCELDHHFEYMESEDGSDVEDSAKDSEDSEEEDYNQIEVRSHLETRKSVPRWVQPVASASTHNSLPGTGRCRGNDLLLQKSRVLAPADPDDGGGLWIER